MSRDRGASRSHRSLPALTLGPLPRTSSGGGAAGREHRRVTSRHSHRSPAGPRPHSPTGRDARLPLPAHKLAALPRHWPRPRAARRADWTAALGPAPHTGGRAGKRQGRDRTREGRGRRRSGRGLRRNGRGFRRSGQGRAGGREFELLLALRKFIFKNQFVPKIEACNRILP